MEWIKVTDELPESDNTFLVYDNYQGIVVRYFNKFHNCWDDEYGDDYYCDAIQGKITHWMTLPNEPKKDEQ
jgi:hypothetical protein